MLDLGLMLLVQEYKYLRKLRNQNLDLFQLTRYRANEKLEKEKIKNIESMNIDTFDINNNFFSARRALKLNHDDYGRNISIIMLN